MKVATSWNELAYPKQICALVHENHRFGIGWWLETDWRSYEALREYSETRWQQLSQSEKGESGDTTVGKRLTILIVGITVCAIVFFAGRAFIDAMRNRAARMKDSNNVVVSTTTVNPEGVQNLYISWGSGSVYVGIDNGSETNGEILVRETYTDTGESEHPLQLDVGQGELIIGLGTEDASKFPETSRYLEVLLPAEMEELDVVHATVSAGSCEVTQVDCAQLRAEASSGRVSIDDVTADKLRLAISSGDADVEGSFSRDVNLDVTSGTIDMTDKVTPRTCTVKVGAGSATLALPHNANFAARARIGAGTFDLGFAYRNEGSTFLVGKGDAEINTLEVDVGSGSLRVEPI